MCHQTVRQNLSASGQASGHLATGPVQEDTGLNHTEDEGDQNQDSDELSHTQSESVAAQDPIEQLEVDDLGCGYNGGKPEEPAEPNEGVHGLCFSSTGDFVGFSRPVSGCSSGNFSNSHMLRRNPSLSDSCTQGQEGPEAAPHLSSPGAMNGETFVQSDDFHAKTPAAMWPEDASGPKRTNGLSSTNSSDHENDKISEIRLPVESSKLLIHVDDSPNCTENGADPQLPLEPPPCPR